MFHEIFYCGDHYVFPWRKKKNSSVDVVKKDCFNVKYTYIRSV